MKIRVNQYWKMLPDDVTGDLVRTYTRYEIEQFVPEDQIWVLVPVTYIEEVE